MLFYDLKKKFFLQPWQLVQMGYNPNDAKQLADASIYSLVIDKPEYNAETEGLERDGEPKPDIEKPFTFVQKMRVYNMLDHWKAKRLADVTSTRWNIENGGITLADGTHILTAIDDQNRISTTIQGMRDSNITEIDFKSASGWLKLTLDQLVKIETAIAQHVQRCFSREKELHTAINSCTTIDELNSIDINTGWNDEPLAINNEDN